MCDVLLPPGVNQMCDVLLPPGVNPTAVKYYIIPYNLNGKLSPGLPWQKQRLTRRNNLFLPANWI
jgi:hypothetical protein